MPPILERHTVIECRFVLVYKRPRPALASIMCHIDPRQISVADRKNHSCFLVPGLDIAKLEIRTVLWSQKGRNVRPCCPPIARSQNRAFGTRNPNNFVRDRCKATELECSIGWLEIPCQSWMIWLRMRLWKTSCRWYY